MAIASVTLGTGDTLILAPSGGTKYGVTSLWICNQDVVANTYTLYFGTTASVSNTFISAQPLAPGETKEFAFERIALDGSLSNVLYGKASAGSVVSVNVSYITL